MVVLGVVGGLGLFGCGGDDGDLGAFCATAEAFVTDNPLAGPGSAAGDAATMTAELRRGADRLARWAEDAPGPVRDDAELLAATAARLADAFDEPGVAGPDEHTAIDAEAAEAASGEVLAFVREECGVDLDAPASTGRPPGGGP